MNRVFNFSAGPAVLPIEVLKQARDEMLDWGDSGMSVMEMSHRGKEFMSIAEKAEADLRELMAIPANYKVLFLQGGASLQFAMIPLNLLRGHNSADYINTGAWSKKAIAEAKRYCEVNIAASSQDNGFNSAPPQLGGTPSGSSPAEASQGLAIGEGPASGPVAPEGRPIAGQPRPVPTEPAPANGG